MLDVLRKTSDLGRLPDIVFFLQYIVGRNPISLKDATVLLKNTPGKHLIDLNALLLLGEHIKLLVFQDDIISLPPVILDSLDNAEALRHQIVRNLVDFLFDNELFSENLFVFDISTSRYRFNHHLFPLHYSAIRNHLYSLGFLEQERLVERKIFWVAEEHEALLKICCIKKKKQISLEMLRKQLENNCQAGEQAEDFVLNFERRRITDDCLRNKIKVISAIDVSAGYDITSFNSNDSLGYDRFIEVKAMSRIGFYWSQNEFNVAKLKGEKYFLYLVDLSCVNHDGYSPLIIGNPAKEILDSSAWHMEPQNYYIQRILD